jgi:hypothetical protein
VIPADEILFLGGIVGIGVYLIGILLGNIAVFRMQKKLNDGRATRRRISPWLVTGLEGQKYHPYYRFRSSFPNDPLVKLSDFSSRLIWIGGPVGLVCLLIEKVRQ